MSGLGDLLTFVLVAAGVFFFIAGTAGLLRFPDTLTRLHALTKADNLGLGLVALGLLPQVQGLSAALKLLAIWALVLFSSAAASQLIGRAAAREGGGALPASGTRTVDRSAREPSAPRRDRAP
jgi:multicomponent Na+:H+ antiporter subunit G